MNRLYADLAALRMRLALARLMLKYNPDQPREPAGGPGGGRWTDGGVQLAGNDAGDGGIATDAQTRSPKPDQGRHVVLPNGKMVTNPYSDTGYLVSPTSDLSAVAGAGRQAGLQYQQMLSSPDPDVQQAALPQFVTSINAAVSQGGDFDYQRTRAGYFSRYTQLPQFRDVSNFNVGVYLQQTGKFSEEDTLSLAGSFARLFSGNYSPDQSYGLAPRTADLIRTGFRTAASGVFGKAAGH